MKRYDFKTMVCAMIENDSRYNGKFYVGVRSTGIYCLPSCKAKMPLLKNITFFNTREEAIAFGLRGCYRCRSETFPDTLPEWLHSVLRLMRENRAMRLNERSLEKIAGVEISTVRRYFKQRHNTTPLAFHRRLRLDHARRLIESGATGLTAAYDIGYESLSGFSHAFTRRFGNPPGHFYEKR